MTRERKQRKTCGKSRWRWAALASAVLGGVMLALEGIMELMVWVLSRSAEEAEAVGIIGGADGPTMVFVTGVTTTGGVPDWLPGVVLLAIGILGWWRLSRCRPESE